MRKYLYLLLLLIFVSCKPLTERLKIQAFLAVKSIDDAEGLIKSHEEAYNSFIKDKGYMLTSVNQEALSDRFDMARDVLANSASNKKAINEYLESDSFTDELPLQSEIADAESKLAQIEALISIPIDRAEKFQQLYIGFEKYKTITDSLIKDIDDSLRSASRFAKITAIKYPKQKESIMSQLMNKIELNVKKNYSVQDTFLVYYKYRKNTSDKFDLKKFTDSYYQILTYKELIYVNVEKFKIRLRELDLSYTKILDDSDAEFFVTVARTSWNESSDSNTDKDYIYNKVKVTESVFEYIDQLDDNATIAEYSTSWGGSTSIHIADSIWKTLNVNVKTGWPSENHNRSEFWVNATEVIYYHKYMIENNGKLDSTDYVVVSEEDYYKYEDAEGLAIYSKTIGYYNSEADTIPAVPGISLVGNSEYGEWRDSLSNHRCHGGHGSYWYFYRPYYYYNTLGGSYNYQRYSDYTTSYRNRTTYYGGVNSDQHYHNYNKHRGRSSESSFRNGRSYRGGGPGGGGK